MRTKALLAFLLLSSFFSQKGWSQDPEFSQFFAAPVHLNPSMIGFSTEARFVLNYRHQYPSFGNAYLTMAASYDQHFDKINSSIGLTVMADRTGGGIYNTYSVGGVYAYQLYLTDDILLKAGAQVSYFNQSIDYDKLVFRDMIDPVSGSTAGGTSEPPLATSSIHRADFSLGAVAYGKRFYVGGAVKHITRPGTGFTSIDDSENRLLVRTAAHAGYVWHIGNRSNRNGSDAAKFYLSPNILFVNQGKFYQLTTGLQAGKRMAFGGMFLRHTMSNIDALILMAGAKAGIFRFGYSYDINIASIGTHAGAHEISLLLDFGKTRQAEKEKQRKRSAECPAIFQP